MPTPSPSTAATSGRDAPVSAFRKRKTGEFSSVGGLLMKSPRSLPAVKTSPAALNSTTRTLESRSASASAAAMPSYIAAVKAFFLSGWLTRIFITPPSRLTWMCSVKVILLEIGVFGQISVHQRRLGSLMAIDQILHVLAEECTPLVGRDVVPVRRDQAAFLRGGIAVLDA